MMGWDMKCLSCGDKFHTGAWGHLRCSACLTKENKMTKEKSITGGEVEALAALDHLEACLDGCYAQHEINVIRAALSRGHLKTTGEDERGVEWVSAPPHGTYEGLLCQFRALKTMINSMGQQISSYSKKDYSLSEKRLAGLQASLDSERAMNAKLTEELDHLASTGRIRGEWQSLGFLSGHVAFKVKGGYFDSAYSQIHGMKNDESIVVYKEQANPDVDPPYRLADDLSVGIKNPTHFMPLPAAPGGE